MALSAFHRAISKSLWFVLFNVCTVIYLLISDRLQWSFIDIFSCGIALLLMNGIALYSSKNFPDWQWTYKQQRDWDQKGMLPVNQSSPDSKES
jgi:hypothetical protein